MLFWFILFGNYFSRFELVLEDGALVRSSVGKEHSNSRLQPPVSVKIRLDRQTDL